MKKTRITALLLALLMAVSTLVSCKGDASDTTSDINTADEVTKNENTADNVTDAETQAPEGESVIEDGTLLYYENFDSRASAENTDKTMYRLSWRILDTKSGALTNPSAILSIREYGDGKALYINNNKTGAVDSYYRILPEGQMGYFHQRNYTVQYDLEYESASETSRYINIVTGYTGKKFMSFHFRNGGRGNNELRLSNGSWKRLDLPGSDAADSTGEGSIVAKLLGKPYDSKTEAFKNIPVSVRYVVEWENGVSVYMRTVSKDTASGGKWVLVSKASDESVGQPHFDPYNFTATVALKVGGAQDGYIDNIKIWTGTGEEPTDTTEPLLRSGKSSCYRHALTKSDCEHSAECRYCDYTEGQALGHNYDGDICKRCERTRVNIENEWFLTALPPYIGGEKPERTYLGGQDNLDAVFDIKDDSEMALIGKTTADEYRTYLKTLESIGYNKTYENKIENDLFAQYEKDDHFVYAYYAANKGEVRVVIDRSSMTGVDKFGYTYEKKAGDTTEFYQIGLPHALNHADMENRLNRGMMYAVKLADNSVIIIDGAEYAQFDDEQIENVMNILYDITDTPKGGVIRVAGWYITHCHEDHLSGFGNVIVKYHENLKFERIFYNFPTLNSDYDEYNGRLNTQTQLAKCIEAYIADDEPVFMQVHTGQEFDLADANIQVLYTHEDLVSAEDGEPKLADDFNNTSTVIKITLDGKTFMMLGDIPIQAASVMMSRYSDDILKSDAVQAAHHVINSMNNMYEKIQAETAFIPQSLEFVQSVGAMNSTLNFIKKYIKDGNVFYANKGTYGVAVVDGKLQKIAEYAVVDVLIHEGINWYANQFK